ncbi:MAG: hypothetical protein ACLQRH_11040 [Acidimicrobiales bacterium]
MVQDIRKVSEEEYWAELRRRWGALLSYRYIGRQFSSMNDVVDTAVTLRHDMRNAVGGVMAAPLAITCPGAGGKSDLEAVPNPVIHSLQVLDDARDVGRIEVVDVQSLKQGRSMGFGRARIVDADDHQRVIALVETQGMSIGDVPPGLQKFEDDPIMHIEDSPDLPPLWKVFGAHRRDDGHWVIPELSLELASPDAALHIGPQQVLLETAAVDLAAELAGTDMLQVESSHVMHLARGKNGPFRVDGSAFGTADGSGRVGVQMTMHDEGNGDRAVTAASMLFRFAAGM